MTALLRPGLHELPNSVFRVLEKSPKQVTMARSLQQQVPA
jgi:hypothetical protein